MCMPGKQRHVANISPIPPDIRNRRSGMRKGAQDAGGQLPLSCGLVVYHASVVILPVEITIEFDTREWPDGNVGYAPLSDRKGSLDFIDKREEPYVVIGHKGLPGERTR